MDLQMDPQEEIVVAHVRRPHGLAGELQLHAETDRPAEVFVPGRMFRISGGGPEGLPDRLTLTGVRAHGGGVLADFEEIPDRTIAERYRGASLALALEEVGAPGEDEYFLHELVGMTVREAGGNAVGEVAAVYDANGRILLSVRREEGESLVPFSAEIVTKVDRGAGTVTIDPPAGLLEL